ncbi:TetR/AcrR family transcriptional regulator [Rhodococcus sp. 2H158]
MAGRTRTEIRGEQSRDDVLRAAEELMSRRGYRATSMADLIRESGVPSSSIYWHFNSKAGVLAAVMERGADAFFASISADVPDNGAVDPQQALERVLRRSIGAALDNPSFLSLYLDFLLHAEDEPAVADQVAGVRRMALETVRTNLRLGYASYGEERAARVADRIAPLAVAFFDGMFVAAKSVDPPDVEQALADVARSLHFVAEATP